MQKVTTRSASGVIERREPFTTSGALRGLWRGKGWYLGTGHLPQEWVDKLRAVNVDVYVVYSYDTPIAWYDILSHDWTIPGVNYSPTTSKHQGNLSRVMAPGTHRGMLGEDWGAKSA